MKTIEEINEKIAREEAIILTAAELKSMVRDGQAISFNDVDVVTTGTFGVMSGTMAVMMVPVAEKCSFEKSGYHLAKWCACSAWTLSKRTSWSCGPCH
jgi:uncharacterized protein (DUF39 family)